MNIKVIVKHNNIFGQFTYETRAESINEIEVLNLISKKEKIELLERFINGQTKLEFGYWTVEILEIMSTLRYKVDLATVYNLTKREINA